MAPPTLSCHHAPLVVVSHVRALTPRPRCDGRHEANLTAPAAMPRPCPDHCPCCPAYICLDLHTTSAPQSTALWTGLVCGPPCYAHRGPGWPDHAQRKAPTLTLHETRPVLQISHYTRRTSRCCSLSVGLPAYHRAGCAMPWVQVAWPWYRHLTRQPHPITTCSQCGAKPLQQPCGVKHEPRVLGNWHAHEPTATLGPTDVGLWIPKIKRPVSANATPAAINLWLTWTCYPCINPYVYKAPCRHYY